MIDESKRAGSSFVCDRCGGEFPIEPGDAEEADAESRALWGTTAEESAEEFAIICDGCFEAVHPRRHPAAYFDTLDRMD
jgi:Fe2+ or Zn2+ uptake regulation protein